MQHPLNRNQRTRALIRYVRWQLGSLLVPGPVAVPFVNQSRLLVSFGMVAATGNIYGGLYEFEDMSFVLHALRPDDLFVDVGANVGTYTVLAGAVVGARVISIEPIPQTFAHLVDNLHLNAITERVDARNVAVGAHAGTLPFTADLGTRNRVADGQAQRCIEVSVQLLDQIVERRSPRLIKIDVEGFETRVVDGAQAVLQVPSLLAVIMEQNGNGARYGFDEQALHRRMIDLGFGTYQYRPLEREIVPDENSTDRPDSGNRLYIREIETARSLVKGAPRFAVLDKLV
jgi:FkbM family methyltransferase